MLGCDGTYPGPGGAASGYLVSAGATAIWLDTGAGTFANLQRLADPTDVDTVILSHEHPDHWSDLEVFAAWAAHGPGRDRPPVPVLAPPGLRERSYYADSPVFTWHETQPAERVAVGELMVSFVATNHGPPTLAARIDAAAHDRGLPQDRGQDGPAASLAYSADTGPEWSFEELGEGLDVALCEATYTAEHEATGLLHLSGRQAGEMAAGAGVGELVVTHRWPTVPAAALVDEASAAFGRSVVQAEVGRVLQW